MKTIGAVILCSFLIAIVAPAQLKMSMTASKTAYAYGETIDVRLRVSNDGDSAYTLWSPTTCVAWIDPDDVTFSTACGQMEVNLLFNPGTSRTWIWHLVPSRYGYPTFTGRHTVWGICKGLDSVSFDAPAFRGGPLWASFYPSVAQAVVDSIGASLNATVVSSFAGASGISVTWQISGYPVDSLAQSLPADPRVRSAQVPRFLLPDSLLVLSVPHATDQPALFRLDQNYPNPFNPATTIRYSIPERSRVTLAVFNTLGEHVATLVDGEQDAGYHDVRFDGSGLSSGVYFYRIRAGAFVQTRRLILVR